MNSGSFLRILFSSKDDAATVTDTGPFRLSLIDN